MQGTKITKESYQKCKDKFPKPEERLFMLYHIHCNPKNKLNSIGVFEAFLTEWLRRLGYNKMNGTLLILRFFDKKFAQ